MALFPLALKVCPLSPSLHPFGHVYIAGCLCSFGLAHPPLLPMQHIYACPSSPLSLLLLLTSLQLCVPWSLPSWETRRVPPTLIFKHLCFLGELKLFYPLNSWGSHPSGNNAAVFGFASPSAVSLIGLHMLHPVFPSGWFHHSCSHLCPPGFFWAFLGVFRRSASKTLRKQNLPPDLLKTPEKSLKIASGKATPPIHRGGEGEAGHEQTSFINKSWQLWKV